MTKRFLFWPLQILHTLLISDTRNNLTGSDFEMLAHRTDGFSGSDIAVVAKMFSLSQFARLKMGCSFLPMVCACHMGQSNLEISRQPCKDLAAKGLGAQIIPPPITQTDYDKVPAR